MHSKIRAEHLAMIDGMSWTSKAYFGGYGQIVAVLKRDNVITLKYLFKDDKTEEWSVISLGEYLSSSNQKFDLVDFRMLVEKFDSVKVEDSLKKFIVNQLRIFMHLHRKDDFEKLDDYSSLTGLSFQDIMSYMRQQNLTRVVELLLEDSSKMLGIAIEDMIGESPFEQTKEPKTFTNKPVGNSMSAK